MDDIAALGREVVEKGFTALKTNIVFPATRLLSISQALAVDLALLTET